MPTTEPKLDVHEVDAARWPDLQRLFESRGGPKNCWCMVWRGQPEDRKDKASKKAAIERMVRADVPIGLLGYLSDQPVAWCSIAPRRTYRELGGIVRAGEPEESVWSLVCFYISRELREQGMMKQLLHAAVGHARQRGACAVEAYPVDPDSPSYRFMGFIPAFAAYGFVEVGLAGSRRHVMRYDFAREVR